MRKLFLIFFFTLSAAALNGIYAQDIPDNEQPMVEERTDINFYGGLLLETHLINQELGVNMGAEMGITYLDHFYLGGYYTALVSQHYRYDIEGHLNTKLRTSFNHGGMVLGYVWKPQSLSNLNFSLKAGWGSIWFFDPLETNTDRLNENYRGTRDRIFVLTPQVAYTITPIQWIRVGVGLGYRVVLGLDRYTSADYNSPVGTITLSFGSFKGKTELPKDDMMNPEP